MRKLAETDGYVARIYLFYCRFEKHKRLLAILSDVQHEFPETGLCADSAADSML